MTETEISDIRSRVCIGIRVAHLRLVEEKFRNGSEIVVAEGKRIRRVRGTELKTMGL